MPQSHQPKVSVVQGSRTGYRAEQGSEYLPGVSAETVGAEALWLGIVTIPPGGRTGAHVHARHESAFYMMSGDGVEMWSGDGHGEELTRCEPVRTGDYIFIPRNTLHVAVNRGAEPAVFIGCRNEPTAQESVVLRPELDGKVP